MKDALINQEGEKVKLRVPEGDELPSTGFTQGNPRYLAPAGAQAEIKVNPESQRLQLLAPFPAWDGKDFTDMPLLIKDVYKRQA